MGFGFIPSNLRVRQRQQPQQQSPNPLAILQFRQQQQQKQQREAADRENEALRSIRKNADQALAQGLEFVRLNPEGNIKNMLPMLRDNGLTFAAEQSLIEAASAVKKRTQDAAKKAAEAPAREQIGRLAAARDLRPPGGAGGVRDPASIDELGRRLSSGLPGEAAEVKGFASELANISSRELDRQAGIDASVKGTLAQIQVNDAVTKERRTEARKIVIEAAKNVKLTPRNPAALVHAQETPGRVFRDPLFGVDAIGKPDDATLQQSRIEVMEWTAQYQAAVEDLAVNEGAGFITNMDQFLARRGIGGEPSQRVQNVEFLKNVTGQAIARAREKGRLSDQDVARSMTLLLETAEARVGPDGKLIGSSRRQLDNLRRIMVNQYSGALSGTYDRAGVRRGVQKTYDEALSLSRIQNEAFADNLKNQTRAVPAGTPEGTVFEGMSPDGFPLFRAPNGDAYEDRP